MNLDLLEADLMYLKTICRFTDFWLAGRGMKSDAPGAVNDYFISPSQHKKYITKYKTFLLIENGEIIVWAVTQKDGSLIHLLVNGYYRHRGYGKSVLAILSPQKIHSKSNQSSGNPAAFYEHCGYEKTETVKSKSRFDIDKLKPDRKPIIDIFEMKT